MWLKRLVSKALSERKFGHLYNKYRRHTMIPRDQFVSNLRLAQRISATPGAVVECGVWRGGMIAAIAEVLNTDEEFYLFDSFEGLPAAKEIDGPAAKEWQADKTSSKYFDNCRAERQFAEQAMQMAGGPKTTIVPGWFSQTLGEFPASEKIALLRLDGDWYESTMECLVALYPKVASQGLVIIDDYFAWDGCSRAVHQFLADQKSKDRLRHTAEGVCYILKG